MVQKLASIALLAALLPASAMAASSAWTDSDGGRVRLITVDKPDTDGRLRGALQIELKPGWKTYWRDPGDAGAPPSIDVSGSDNVSGVEIMFPPPERYDDGYAVSAVYHEPVSLALDFDVSDPEKPATIAADVFLGICETICIPVQFHVDLDPSAGSDQAGDRELVDSAFEAVPPPASDAFGVSVLDGAADEVKVAAELPGKDDAAEFFLAGTDGYFLGAPKRRVMTDKVEFTVPVLERPESAPDGEGLHYILIGKQGAVRGVIPYP